MQKHHNHNLRQRLPMLLACLDWSDACLLSGACCQCRCCVRSLKIPRRTPWSTSKLQSLAEAATDIRSLGIISPWCHVLLQAAQGKAWLLASLTRTQGGCVQQHHNQPLTAPFHAPDVLRLLRCLLAELRLLPMSVLC